MKERTRGNIRNLIYRSGILLENIFMFKIYLMIDHTDNVPVLAAGGAIKSRFLS